jgi:hypothetical protein
VIIPEAIAGLVAEAAADVDAAERDLIRYCQSQDFSLEGLKQAAGRLETRFLEIVDRRKGAKYLRMGNE